MLTQIIKYYQKLLKKISESKDEKRMVIMKLKKEFIKYIWKRIQ